MVVIQMVCTDRNGKRLASETVRGETYAGTLKERLAINERFMRDYRDPSGQTPYIFRHVNPGGSYYEA